MQAMHLRLFAKWILGLIVLNLNYVWGAPPPEICAGGAICTNPVISSSYRVDNRVYAGLVWNLDGSSGFVPDLVLGARSLNVNSSNSVSGADLNVRLTHNAAMFLDSIRLSYVGGTREVMGNAGLGYSFTGANLLGTVAAQAAYSRVGADWIFSKNAAKPYIEVNSLYAPKPVDTSLGCPTGAGYLVSAASVGARDSQATNGMTCRRSVPV